MNKIVYFVRHGQTVANVTGQVQGPDDPLDEVGLKQAAVVAARTRSFHFERIVSSDYSRARVTAEAIQLATGRPITLSEYFQEFRRPSVFWGRVPKDDPEVLAGYKLMNEHFGDEDWHFTDEENIFDLKTRGVGALRYLLARPEQKLLVVTHGNFLRAMLGVMLRGEKAYSPQDYLDMESTFEFDNTSITIAQYKYHWRRASDTWVIKSLNDCSHLGEMK